MNMATEKPPPSHRHHAITPPSHLGGMAILDKGRTGEVHWPGFTSGMYDRTGAVAPWKILKLILSGRFKLWSTPDFLQGKMIIPGVDNSQSITLFQIMSELEFERIFYERSRLATSKGYLPMLLTHNYVGSRKSSVKFVDTLRDVHDGKLFVTVSTIFVAVDTAMKRPVSKFDVYLPEVYRDQPYAATDRNRQAISGYPVFSSKFQPTFSDDDFNHHTNANSYTRFCFDSATAASFERKLRHFSGDICRYKLKKMTNRFLKETKALDILTLTLFENPEEPDKLFFRYTRDDGTIVMECILAFYRDETPKL